MSTTRLQLCVNRAALAGASRSFDPSRGIPFGSFATTRIRGALLELKTIDDDVQRAVVLSLQGFTARPTTPRSPPRATSTPAWA